MLDQVFAKLQQEQILRLKIEAFSLDSTSVKVHLDGAGGGDMEVSPSRFPFSMALF